MTTNNSVSNIKPLSRSFLVFSIKSTSIKCYSIHSILCSVLEFVSMFELAKVNINFSWFFLDKFHDLLILGGLSIYIISYITSNSGISLIN